MRWSPLTVAAIAGGLTAAVLLATGWGELSRTLRGTDDAMRLVEVRRLLDGAGWFDLSEPRVGLGSGEPGAGYVAHWSRLIDAPLAGMIALLSLFTDRAGAEALTRALWPLLLLPAMIMAQASVATALGGRKAGLIAALLGALCVPGLVQFTPGVIDHHNVQMLLCALALNFAVVALVRGPGRGAERFGALSGVIVAVAVGVGVETLPILGAIAGAVALAFVRAPRTAPVVGAFGAGLAVATSLVFLALVPPASWAVPACDALAVNTLALLGVGGAALWLVTRIEAGTRVRFAAVSGAGALALGAWALAGPGCVSGLGFIDPVLKPLWLDHVLEMRTGAALWRQDPQLTLLLFGFPLAAAVSLIGLRTRLRDPAFLVLGAAFGASLLVAVLVIRSTGYANWFAVPVAALALARLRSPAGVRPPLFRAATIAAINPMTIAFGALMIAPDAAPRSEPGAPKREARRCYEGANLARSLGPLEPGLILAHIDLGPHILAHTRHRVVVAPYHRLRDEMVFAQSVFADRPDAAEARIRAARIDYVVDCEGLRNPFVDRIVDRPTLRTQLLMGPAPAYLEETPRAPGGADRSPVRVWRVAPDHGMRP